MSDQFQSYSRIIALIAFICASNCSAQMTHEEYRRSLTPENKLKEWLHVLDDPAWYEKAAWIQAIIQNNERQEPAKRVSDPISGLVRTHEVSCIGMVSEADLPPTELKNLLTKYLQHHNPEVASFAYSRLVDKRLWSIEQAMEYARQQKTSSAWWAILDLRGDELSPQRKLEIARTYLTARLAEPPPPPSPRADLPRPRLTFDADVCAILVKSAEASDRDLVRKMLMTDTDSPYLWAVVGRMPIDQETERLARAIWDSDAKPLPLRCAAALAFGRKDPAILNAVYAHIHDYLNEFVTPEFDEYMKNAYRLGVLQASADPEFKDKTARLSRNDQLLASLAELPTEFMKTHVAELVHYNTGLYGQDVGGILARRVPDEFVGEVEKLPQVPESFFAPLVLAANRRTVLEPKVEKLVPTKERERFEELARMKGARNLPGAGGHLSVWD